MIDWVGGCCCVEIDFLIGGIFVVYIVELCDYFVGYVGGDVVWY